MNEQLQKFIEWLPQNVEEFKDKSADEIAQILNQLSQTDEGKQQLSQLMGQFNSSVSQFRAGGKFASFVKKFSNGGGILFAEDGTKYDREAARKQKAGLWSNVTDDFGTYQVRHSGDQNVLAKKMKAMNVEGFNNSNLFDMGNTTFNRADYRARKAQARQMMPGWNRRQVKAYALSNLPIEALQTATTGESVAPRNYYDWDQIRKDDAIEQLVMQDEMQQTDAAPITLNTRGLEALTTMNLPNIGTDEIKSDIENFERSKRIEKEREAIHRQIMAKHPYYIFPDQIKPYQYTRGEIHAASTAVGDKMYGEVPKDHYRVVYTFPNDYETYLQHSRDVDGYVDDHGITYDVALVPNILQSFPARSKAPEWKSKK